MRMRDPGLFLTVDPGSGMEKIWIRDKHPASATQLPRDKHDITPSCKHLAGSGSKYGSGKHYSESGQLRIQNKYEVKLL